MKNENTKWTLWKCDNFRRWATVANGPFSEDEENGQECNFSGCAANHKKHIVGETDIRESAHKWFRGNNS